MIMPAVIAGFTMTFFTLLTFLMAAFAAPHVFGAFAVAVAFVAAVSVKDHIFQRLAGAAMRSRAATATGARLAAAHVLRAFAFMAAIGVPTVVPAFMPALGISQTDEADPGDRGR